MTQTIKTGIRVFTLTLAMFWAAGTALAEDKDHGEHGMAARWFRQLLSVVAILALAALGLRPVYEISSDLEEDESKSE